ncbi:MAG: SGNH/GDSL hydrolase family protein, partial [Bacteroidaceae bacterium]|nr:SGNH/GDSL hydrolase family protein [Bacteroidaceae bacterium]
YSSAVIGANVHAIIFYDKDGGVISGVEGDATNAVGTLSFTEEQLKADSFRVQFYANSEAMAEKRSICYVTRYMQLPTSVRVNNLENDVAELIKGNGLKVLIFGDSITTNADFSINENHQTTAYTFKEKGNGYEDENGNWVSFSMWPYLMTKYLSCSDVRNYAQNGASYTERERESGYERQNLSYQVKLALNDRTNPNGAFTTDGDFVPDVIIFALGTNDGNPNDTYDSAMAKTVTLADGKTFDVEATLANLDVTKTCEAMRYAFLKVKQAFPQSLCLCVLPIQRANTENLGINDVLEKMAKRYSIKIVDGYSELGVVRDLEIWNGFGTNLKDGLHPNDKGQKLYTRMMVNAIKNNWLAL